MNIDIIEAYSLNKIYTARLCELIYKNQRTPFSLLCHEVGGLSTVFSSENVK